MDDPTNDRPDRPDDAVESTLRERMAWIGDQIPVPSPGDDLTGVERRAGRRVRRRRIVAGLIGAAALVVGAAVVIDIGDDDDDGSDSIALTADEPEQADDEGADDGSVDDDAARDDGSDASSDADEEPSAEQSPAEDSSAVASSPSVDGDGDGAGTVTAIEAGAGSTTTATAERTTVEQAAAPGEFSDTRIVAWQDGFLSLETRFPAQPLPGEFSEEISELFSAEVTELIQTEQPATIDEATALLSEAGLLDEVTEVLTEHPEAYEAIYAIETPRPETSARFTRDGVEWRPVELAPPLTDWFSGGVHSDGTRLVLWEIVFPQAPEPADPLSSYAPPLGPESVRLASSTDLVTWEVVEVSTASLDAVPDGFVEMVYPSSVAVSGDRYAVELDRMVEPDLERLFADVLADRGDATRYGMGTSIDESGVTLELFAENGIDVERVTRTWDELGVEPFVPGEPHQSRRTLEVGSFDGSFAATSELDGYGTTVGVEGVGFLRVGAPSFVSADGVEWAEIDTLGIGGSPVGPLLQYDGRVVAFGSDGPDEPGVAFELDLVDLVWRPVEGPTVPANSSPQFGGAPSVSSAVLYQVPPPYEAEPFEVSASIVVDGYTFTQTRTQVGEGYSLARDGVEIVAEYLDWREMEGNEGGPFDHVRFGPDGTVVTDPDTGEELLTLTESEMRSLWMQLDVSTPIDEVYVEPETRLLATDGERWLDEQVVASVVHEPDETGDAMPRWATGVAANDGVVLVAFGDGSIERFEF